MALMSLRDHFVAAARPVGFTAILLAVSLAPARGQGTPPPATAGSGTIALEGSMQKFYRGANVVVVATVDGAEHVFAFTRDLIVHGGKRPGPDALSGLQSGTMVVVHYTVSGATASATEVDVIGVDGLKIVEGRVVHIDRRKGQITLKYDDGTEEQFLLTEHAVTETTQPGVPADGAQVTIYYTDDIGRKVIHYFKQTP
jgi:hypothetical protein